ncbi:TIGR02391 family protein [Corynebacterium bovis]|uniref:TIGR02391 family protein n=1 Tax=Corynebacterium bovis TaxID=36808 RepID=UPI003139AFB7
MSLSKPTDSKFSPSSLRLIAGVLADTDDGLTGREIGDLLKDLDMPDSGSGETKRVRLAKAFDNAQTRDENAKPILEFIASAMQSVRYVDDRGRFYRRQGKLNKILAYAGLRVDDRGEVVSGELARNLDEADKIANSIHDELDRRKCHPEVLRYCSVEVLKEAYFHACLEATKSIFDRLRSMTGASGDGAALVDTVLALGKSGPMLAINSLRTQTEKDEQTGLANLVKGLNGLYRNPTAHDPRLSRKISDDELLEVLTMVSVVHRRLDGASSSNGVFP